MIRSGGSGRPYSREEICWGSFERNTGAWCPFTEQDAIEAAYQANEASIHLPACFDATVHFSEPHCFQRTPAVGSKPSGFRSVLRGEVGSVVRLHYWASSKTFRLDAPTNEPPSYVVDVKIEAAPQERPVAWQWLDLPPSALASAMDLNWHSFAPEHSEAIEQASRATMGRVEIIIGLTKYVIQNFNGAYAEQRNERTGARRSVRRGYASDAAPPAAPDDLASDFCGLCTEKFSETAHWPVHRLPECGHAFHHSCIQHVLTAPNAYTRKCPICRRTLARPPVAPSSSIAQGRPAPAPRPGTGGGGRVGMDPDEARRFVDPRNLGDFSSSAQDAYVGRGPSARTPSSRRWF